ncbi:MAG: TIGR03620 family F420-dependent LLM class oxidoreductase [Actinomycetota bacterium]
MDLSSLNTTGAWMFVDTLSAAETEQLAQRLEGLGYSALWIPDTVGRDPFVSSATMLNATESLILATGIANVWMRHPGAMKQAGMALAEMSGDRFVLGIGVSHQPMVEMVRGMDYSKPLTMMKEYLAGIDASPWRATPANMPPVVLAALGPKMLELSRDASAGAHPYWTTPEHTAQAKEILGDDSLLCVEQKVCLTTDRDAAYEKAAEQLGIYKPLPNYRNNWKRLGFTEDQIEHNDPAFVDAVFAWGDADALNARVQAHYDAGATHVCVQPIHPTAERGTVDWDCLEALAPNG